MALKKIGAGLGRTGMLSLKIGLERLLGEPCYHMVDVFDHPEHMPIWENAVHGRPPDWEEVTARLWMSPQLPSGVSGRV